MSILVSCRERHSATPTTLVLFLLVVAALAIFAGCAVDNDGGTRPITGLAADCKGCHTDKDMLVASAAPDTSTGSESSGEG
jgi:hypothetical protein